MAIREIGFGEMAFGKLDFGKTDIQENGFRQIGFRKNGLSEKRNSEKRISGDWIWDFGQLPPRSIRIDLIEIISNRTRPQRTIAQTRFDSILYRYFIDMFQFISNRSLLRYINLESIFVCTPQVTKLFSEEKSTGWIKEEGAVEDLSLIHISEPTRPY